MWIITSVSKIGLVAESLKIPEICWKNGGELSDR
jgi:hypothetical protein